MKTNVAFFFGCMSVEHEVSIISAVQAMLAVDTEKYNVIPVYVTKNGEMFTGDSLLKIENYRDLPALLKNVWAVNFVRRGDKVLMVKDTKGVFAKKSETVIDVAFPVVHGTNCEDGTIQGYLEFLGLPYVGCNVLASAVGMDKAVFKDVLKRHGLPVLDCVTFYSREYAKNPEGIKAEILEKIGLPAIIKPINLGSSVGISKAKNEDELIAAIELAASFADRILVERAIENLREINCSVLGNATDCRASVCEEPFMKDEILSYEDKYLSSGKSKGMASLGRKIPADLDEARSNEIRELACKIFKAIDGNGVVRIDFMIDKDTDTVYANEINTIPGSLAFYLWDATGLKYKDLLDEMITLAFKRAREKENITFTIDTNILAGVSFGGSKGAKGGKL